MCERYKDLQSIEKENGVNYKKRTFKDLNARAWLPGKQKPFAKKK